ncbi:MAG: molybdenum cofactor guanylyltransferase [Chloroflexi bacterium]|nr:molybdenum cofactor guanylyltransferase [Chloroflexota bacterium]
MDLAVVVLAGGRSRRMGRDKALLPVGRERLLERVVRRVAQVGPVWVVTRGPDDYPFLRVPRVPDVYPDRGPVGGLLTGFQAVPARLVAAVATDMPFASPQLLQHLAQYLDAHPEVDVALPEDAHGIQPLHAVYRREPALRAFRAALQTPRAAIRDALALLRVRRFSADALRAALGPTCDPARAFWNVNTPDAYDALLRVVQGDAPSPLPWEASA